MSLAQTMSPLMIRIGVGKAIGLAFGLIGFFMLPYLAPESGQMLRWGILCWYVTMGAIIGAFGVFDWHPILKLPMPWWVRAPMVGAWLNFVLVLFAYDRFAFVMSQVMGDGAFISSPFWFALEGAIVGLIIGFGATRIAGEGPETAKMPEGGQKGMTS